ncbi:MAG: carbohydrate ABC transporter permease [Spirochaetales bacterium]|nr:carbohydrate ABC transporter permease [Spirochaetales bacterium]
MKKLPFYICMVALSSLILFPILFLVLTSLKSPTEFFGRSVFSLPRQFTLINFSKAFIEGKLSRYILNGLFLCALKVPLGILIESSAAFSIARLKIRFANGIFILFLIGMMIPMQICLVPLNIGLRTLNLFNTYSGLIFVYLGFGIPFGILILRGFFRTIPQELDEAAIIDGCSKMSLFTKIILPLAKPAVATLLILDTLGTWNEYLLISVFITNDNMRTVPAGLLSFIGENETAYGLLSAGVLISIIPVLIVFIIFQRHFVEGMSGALKG